jgi:hypothetical protein
MMRLALLFIVIASFSFSYADKGTARYRDAADARLTSMQNCFEKLLETKRVLQKSLDEAHAIVGE